MPYVRYITQGILTHRRYTQLKFKFKFSALLKANDDKYKMKTEKNNFSKYIVVGSVLPGVIYRSICRNSFFYGLLNRRKRTLLFMEYLTNPYLRNTYNCI